MAANATAVWRARPSGVNTNGGGFDCSISAAATGTNGSFTGTTFTDATAAAFTAGMVGSSINITGIGQYLITARIDASNITLGSGNPGLTLSGGMAWTVGSGQDYSQQNAAQVSQSSTANTSTATTTLTDTGAAFTAALIGNGIRVSGTGITTTFTFITAVPSGTTLTLQTSPGTTGTAVSYNVGGGWADPATNMTAAVAAIAPGNRIYVLGSGTPNPAAYSYDYTLNSNTTITPGLISGVINFSNDPATPGYKQPPDTSAGMPLIKCNGNAIAFTVQYTRFSGLYFVGTTAGAIAVAGSGGIANPDIFGCVYDSVATLNSQLTSAAISVIGCEAFTSTGSTNSTTYVIASANSVVGCNIHDFNGGGVNPSTSGFVFGCIIAKNRLDGILVAGNNSIIINNTIDGNLTNGIEMTTQTLLNTVVIMNNIISNHVTAGKFGITCGGGTAASNPGQRIDYNVFYNNNADLNAVCYGPHDTHGGSNPYVAQSTENYTLA